MTNIICVIALIACALHAHASSASDDAMTIVNKWVTALPFPDSTEVSKELTDYTVFADIADNWLDGKARFYSVSPPTVATTKEDHEQLVADIGALLRRGVNRLTSRLLTFLPTVKQSSLHFVVHKVRAILNSYNDFYVQLNNSLSLGPRNLMDLEEHAEYGPETNFWIKFRNYLNCGSVHRLGPEKGGGSTWCNLEYFRRHPPVGVWSAGYENNNDGDFSFEDSVLRLFPESTVVRTDCNEAATTPHQGGDRFIQVDRCVHGNADDLAVFPSNVHQTKVRRFSEFAAEHKDRIPHFDVHKVRLDGLEMSVYAEMMMNPDTALHNNKLLLLEMTRVGGPMYGLSWDSMLLTQLFFATMYSGGYHAVSQEKWHDGHSTIDYVFANQTWLLQSELEAFEGVPTDPLSLDTKGFGGDTEQFGWSSDYKFTERDQEEFLSVHTTNYRKSPVQWMWAGWQCREPGCDMEGMREATGPIGPSETDGFSGPAPHYFQLKDLAGQEDSRLMDLHEIGAMCNKYGVPGCRYGPPDQ